MRLSDWQPKYAAAGLWLFPVTMTDGTKRPTVKGYLKSGPRSSNHYAEAFGDLQSFGFACGSKSGITVLDIDTPNVRYLWTALDKHGRTPIVVETASGKYHAWYRYNGEGRHIRPWGHLPIDVLGGGFVVAPPSQAPGGPRGYSFLTGGLEDISRLPTLQEVEDLKAPPATKKQIIAPAEQLGAPEGKRGNECWKFCMQQAPNCDTVDQLIQRALVWAAACTPPLEKDRAVKAAESAWKHDTSGSNWIAMARANEIESMIAGGRATQDAYLLLQWLREREGTNRDRPFWIPTGLAKKFRWGPTRLRAARRILEKTHLKEVRHGNQFTGASQFVWQRRAMSPIEHLSL
jgi:hypothetical protein